MATSFTARAIAEFVEHKNAGPETAALRRTLIEEESDELLEALDEGDVAHIARELADVVYVAYGTARFYGIDLDEALVEIHRAAMDKVKVGLRRADGKIIKYPGFQPPDMSKALAA